MKPALLYPPIMLSYIEQGITYHADNNSRARARG